MQNQEITSSSLTELCKVPNLDAIQVQTFSPEEIDSEIRGYIPKIKKDHYFTEERVMDLAEYYLSGFQDGSLYITGQRGVGKSSTVEQFFARIGLPVVRCNADANKEVVDFFGSQELIDGNSVWVDGLLTLAARHGGIFLLDEADALLPEVLIGLNQINEMSEFTIPGHSGVVKLHPNFRVVFAGNTAGFGDDTGEYSGTNQQNSASMDRFSMLEWGYLSQQEELTIIMKATGCKPELEPMISSLVSVANLTRLADGNIPDISPRSAIRWARKVLVFKSKSFQYSFDRAIGYRYPKDVRMAMHQIAEGKIGNAFFGDRI